MKSQNKLSSISRSENSFFLSTILFFSLFALSFQVSFVKGDPLSPISVTASQGLYSDSVFLSWEWGGDIGNGLSFEIVRSIENGFPASESVILLSDSDTIRSYKDITVVPGIKYNYRIRAIKSVNVSGVIRDEISNYSETVYGWAWSAYSRDMLSQPEGLIVNEGERAFFSVGFQTDVHTEELSTMIDVGYSLYSLFPIQVGSPESEMGHEVDEKLHKVTRDSQFNNTFFLGQYEVTQALWKDVMGGDNNPSIHKGNSLPIENITWFEAIDFCDKLTARERAAGKISNVMEYTLPTESQWEIACRAGTTTALNNQTDLTSIDYNCANLDLVGWYVSNSGSTTHPVGEKAANILTDSYSGEKKILFYDMHGNVSEWCLDWYDVYPGENVGYMYRGSDTGLEKIHRGGSYADIAKLCRSSSRGKSIPETKSGQIGFRLALSSIPNAIVFQWYKDGEPIIGATNNTYSVSKVTLSDEGKYTLKVKDYLGVLMSDEVSLTVVPKKIFPVSVVIDGVSSVVLGEEAPYTATVFYSDGSKKTMDSIDSSNLIWDISKGDDFANIDCNTGILTATGIGISSVCATYTENGRTVKGEKEVSIIGVAPTIIQQPKSITVDALDSSFFDVIATGTKPLNYQWIKDGNIIAGATNSIYSISETQIKDEGVYSVLVSNLYGNISSETAILSVNPRNLEVKVNDVSIIYGEIPVFSYSVSGLQKGEDLSGIANYTILKSDTIPIPVGTYTVLINGLYISDYEIEFIPGTLFVNKANPAIAWSAPAPISYGTALSATELSATSNVEGSFVYSIETVPVMIGDILDADTYSITATFTPKDATNYGTATVDVELVIDPLEVELNWTEQSAFTFDGAEHTYEATITNALEDDKINLVYSEQSILTATAVGEYTAEITDIDGVNAANYVLPSDGLKMNWSITTAPVPANITLTGYTGIYDGQNHSLSVNGTQAGDAITYSIDNATWSGVAPTFSDVVKAAVYVKVQRSGYQDWIGNTTIQINASSVAVDWVSASSYVYIGSDQGKTVSASYKNVAGNPVALSVSFDTAFQNAGSYIATASMVNVDPNYTLTGTTKSLSIAKANQTITFGALVSKVYGDTAFDLDANASSGLPVTYTSSNVGVAIINGKAITIIGAGETFIVANQIGNENYEAAISVTQKQIVNKRIVTITWPTESTFAYDGSEKTHAPTIGNVVENDEVTLVTENTSATSSGTYTARVTNLSGAKSGNYRLPTDGLISDWKISNAAITGITLTGYTGVYDGKAHGITLSGTQAGDTVTYRIESGEFSATAPTRTNAGTTEVTVKIERASYDDWTGKANIVISKATPVITWAAPAPITYGAELSNAQLNATANVEGIFVYDPAIGIKLNAGTQKLNATFTPKDAANYNNASATVELVVNKATPAITWSAPAPITYGTALSATELSATSNVEGIFVYDPAVGVKLNAGTHSLRVIFTPADEANYNRASGSVQLLVKDVSMPGDPVISWAAPAPIVYGTALSGIQLNAVANVEGTFAYNPSVGTILDAGTHSLTAVFTPKDSAKYNVVTASVNIKVNKATPILSWVVPQYIVYGRLNGQYLNATADISGSFIYTPNEGSILELGENTLLVTFTPEVEKNYNVVTMSVPVSVVMEVVAVEPGTFMMGSPVNEIGRTPKESQHKVTLTNPYHIGKYEVTQGQYKTVMGYNPSAYSEHFDDATGIGKLYPVDNVRWSDAVEFCKKLTARERKLGRFIQEFGVDCEYVLPTEAQWEYACRAGTTNAFNNGLNLSQDNGSELNDVAWYYDNSDIHSHVVGLKKPNAWGIYDMHGNVSEWCSDLYGNYPTEDVIDPIGPEEGGANVWRGGSYFYSSDICRSAYRDDGKSSSNFYYIGLRVVLVPVKVSESEPDIQFTITTESGKNLIVLNYEGTLQWSDNLTDWNDVEDAIGSSYQVDTSKHNVRFYRVIKRF